MSNYFTPSTAMTSLDQLLQERITKLEELSTATVLLKHRDALQEQLFEAKLVMDAVTKGVELMRTDLEKMKAQNMYCRELSEKLSFLDKKIVCMTDNLPVQFLQEFIRLNTEMSPMVENSKMADSSSRQERVNDKANCQILRQITDRTADMTLITPEHRIQDCKKTLFKNSDDSYTMEFITAEEFSKIPKYMIGRQSMAMVNELVATINTILEEKYSVLALGKAGARKKGKLDLYMSLEREKIPVTPGGDPKYFFTAEDWARQTETKLDKKKLNLLTVLRHCKRLKEIRTGKNLQYVLVSSWERSKSGIHD